MSSRKSPTPVSARESPRNVAPPTDVPPMRVKCCGPSTFDRRAGAAQRSGLRERGAEWRQRVLADRNSITLASTRNASEQVQHRRVRQAADRLTGIAIKRNNE
eukprot:6189351-Pleurochrysis_carterae.AAC.5